MARFRARLRKVCAVAALSASGFVSPQAFAAADSPRCVVPAGTVPFEFASDGNRLRGFIDLPATAGRHPAIVIVHGSGTTDVAKGEGTYNGSYREMRAAFRSAGIATVVWDKAGNGCSDGRYMHVDDVYARANEIIVAVEALQARGDIDDSRIGVWGISQGGWVAPIAAVRSPAIKYLILVSGPGKDFFSTSEYQAVNQLRADGVPEQDIEAAISAMRRALIVMRAGGTYEEFTKASEPLLKYPVFGKQLGITGGTPETYAKGKSPPFMRIWTTSADTYLSGLEVPLLAIFGDRDVKINWRESVRAYREAYGRAGSRDLTIKVFEGANHELFPENPAKAAQSPHASPLVPDYLATMIGWLRARDFTAPAATVKATK